jgi:hypothetical protein
MAKRKKKRTLPKKQAQQRIVVGITWYTSETFSRMKTVAADADGLDDTFEDWRKNVKRLVQQLEKEGHQVVKVPIDIDEWVAWCHANDQPLNGESRSSFVSQKTSEMAEASPPSDQFVTRRIKPRRNPLPFLDKLEELFEVERDRSTPPPYPFDSKRNLIHLPKEVEDNLRQLARSGQKVKAIQQVTKLTGAGLRVSKDYVDSLIP